MSIFKVIIFGGVIGVYATLSAFVNSLARHGLRTWRRVLLVPWLGLYSLVYIALLLWTAESLYRESLAWRHLFLLVALFSIFSCWRHMMAQFRLMTRPRPQVCVVSNVQS